ncbi:hypothetical protein [Sulfurihydrogenibium sp.]|uniref:hypothetical protein n=1 Tax=Sulfurihydrogenibium sp. TaxID=2053621 RepID=UPI00262E8EC0|nr:hypothetical protein [Sulfurihydrogenibium sp.]
MKRILFIFGICLILLSGCKKPVYYKIYDSSYVGKISCLKIESNDYLIKEKVSKFLKKGIINSGCNIKLVIYAKYLTQCNNPNVKAFGADFDGYLRFSVIDENKNLEIFRIQTDFKDYPQEDIIKQMIAITEKQLRL